MSTENTKVAVKKQDITKTVLEKVNAFQESGQLKIPKSFSPENALKGAYLILQESVTRDKKPVLEACSQESIANSLLKMVVLGLTPLKKQGSFIAYGKKLEWVTEYAGNIALAKRYGNLKTIVTNVIYEDDDFEFRINPETGIKELVKHNQTLESIGSKNAKGVYSIYTLNDGTVDMDIMSINQVKDSWNQGAMKGNGPHKTFVEAMIKKTSINRTCKLLIRSSNDSVLYDEESLENRDVVKEDVKHTISQEANSTIIDIEEAEVVEPEVIEGKAVSNKKSEPNF